MKCPSDPPFKMNDKIPPVNLNYVILAIKPAICCCKSTFRRTSSARIYLWFPSPPLSPSTDLTQTAVCLFILQDPFESAQFGNDDFV